MWTKIKASYVVGFDGAGHRMIRDGVVVYEDDRVLYVGKSFKEPVDETIEACGRLVCSGFVNIHALTVSALAATIPEGSLDVVLRRANTSTCYLKSA